METIKENSYHDFTTKELEDILKAHLVSKGIGVPPAKYFVSLHDDNYQRSEPHVRLHITETFEVERKRRIIPK